MKKISIALVGVVFLRTSVGYAFPIPSKESCEFYLDLEKELKCVGNETDPSDYLTTYGYAFCSKLQTTERKAGTDLTKWIKETRYCLQKALVDDPRLLKPCSKMERTAFNAHAPCYKNYGFCELKPEEREEVSREIGSVDLESNRATLAQVADIGISCPMGISEGLFHLYQILKSMVSGKSRSVKTAALELWNDVPKDKKIERKFVEAALLVLEERSASNYVLEGVSEEGTDPTPYDQYAAGTKVRKGTSIGKQWEMMGAASRLTGNELDSSSLGKIREAHMAAKKAAKER